MPGGDPPQEMMLFDLQADPAEQHDVAAEHPEVVKRLKDLYDRMAGQALPASATAPPKILR